MDSYSASSHSTQFPSQYQQEIESRNPPPAFRSALHSVRRPPSKNIITKKPIAPLPPTPPKIYKVDPMDFRDVVQKLTSAPEFQPTRLQDVAPPPLCLSPPHQRKALAFPYVEKPLTSPNFDNNSLFGALSPLGLSLSPASLAWCSSVLLSPGTLAFLEPTAAL